MHVILIGLDGTSPNGIEKAPTHVIHRMMDQGSYTLHARGVIPTVSSPNWASMIMGAGPAQHGVTSNDWKPDKFEIGATARGPAGIFPTIFGILREQRPNASIGIFHDWKDFARLVEPKAPSVIEHGKGPADTTERAIRYLKDSKPAFLFIHLDHVDHAGHKFGHGSKKYYEAVTEADRLIGVILAAVKEAGIEKSTYVLITADHGGVGGKHGGMTMAELEIPWIIIGPGVAKNREIRAPVNTYDTAATIAAIFKLKTPEAWIGRPVKLR